MIFLLARILLSDFWKNIFASFLITSANFGSNSIQSMYLECPYEGTGSDSLQKCVLTYEDPSKPLIHSNLHTLHILFCYSKFWLVSKSMVSIAMLEVFPSSSNG